MKRFGMGMLAFVVGLSLYAEESPAEVVGRKVFQALYELDFATVQANTPEWHPYGMANADFSEMEANLRHTQKMLGPLVEITNVREEQRGKQKMVFADLHFANGVYQGWLFLTEDNKQRGMTIPMVDAGVEIPILTVDQMRADWDYLCRTLDEAMPHKISIKAIYGIDVDAKLAEYREKITGDMNALDFISMIGSALEACKGSHLWVAPASKEVPGEPLPPDVALAKTLMRLRMLRVNGDMPQGPTVDVVYWQGDYYTPNDFRVNLTTYPGRAKLLKVDGKTVAELEASVVDRLPFFDAERRKFYWENFYMLIAPVKPNERTFTFVGADGKEFSVTVSSTDSVAEISDSMPIYKFDTSVDYLPEAETVYLRVPRMDSKSLENYYQQLDPILKEKRPRFAVIDIRGNGGGSDFVPMGLLEHLLGQMHFSGKLVVPANARMMEMLTQRGTVDDPAELKAEAVPLLNGEMFYVLTGVKVSEAMPEFPVEHVYVLAHDIYSSAGTLTMFAANDDRITSIGWDSPLPLGRGIDPYHFILPESKVPIQVEPALDIDGCNDVTECFHTKMEHPVNLSSDEYFEYHARKINPDDRINYLLQHDPFMQQALNLMRQVPAPVAQP